MQESFPDSPVRRGGLFSVPRVEITRAECYNNAWEITEINSAPLLQIRGRRGQETRFDAEEVLYRNRFRRHRV